MGQIIVAILTFIALCVFVLFLCGLAISSAVAGGLWSLVNFAKAEHDTLGPTPLPRPPFGPDAPTAIRKYVFAKGYRDLAKAWRETYSRNTASARAAFTTAKIAGLDSVNGATQAAANAGFAAGLGVLLGPLVALVPLSLHTILLVVASGLVGVAVVIMWVVDQAFSLIRGFIFVCPRCHHRLALPVYLCRACGAPHVHLTPSTHGAFRAHCRCGEELPAAGILGRGQLKSRCPECSYELTRAHTEARKICLPIVGAASAGKTSYVFGLVQDITGTVAPAHGLTSRILSSEAARLVGAGAAEMKRGAAPSKTVDHQPHAVDLILERDNKPFRAIYLYDPAGEAFQSSSDLAEHRFLDYPNGIFLILDPFSFAAVSSTLGGSVTSRARAADAQAGNVATYLINILQSDFGMKPTAISKTPVAVLVNKIDEANLEAHIGPDAIALVDRLSPKETADQHRNRVIRQQLIDWGQVAVVSQLETHFKTISFFGVSALGRSDDGSTQQMKPRHILAPFYWILKEAGERWIREGNG